MAELKISVERTVDKIILQVLLTDRDISELFRNGTLIINQFAGERQIELTLLNTKKEK